MAGLIITSSTPTVSTSSTALIGIWIKLLRVPYRFLFPAIIVFCAIGLYTLNNNPFDVYMGALFGVIGIVFYKFGCEPAPLLLGFILGPLLEDHLRRSLIISRGDPSIFIDRPISAILLVLAVAALAIAILPTIRRRREVVFAEEDGG